MFRPIDRFWNLLYSLSRSRGYYEPSLLTTYFTSGWVVSDENNSGEVDCVSSCISFLLVVLLWIRWAESKIFKPNLVIKILSIKIKIEISNRIFEI